MTPKTLTKRAFLGYGASGVTLAALAGVGSLGGGFGATAANAGGPIAKGDFPISYSTEEWRRRLTDKEFYILREAGTERPGTSPLNAEKRRGIFACAACGNYVYTSLTKFESNTGWPSFWAPVKDGVGYADDRSLFITRTEV
ncbi:MAG: peptide-methionine (R)-S-oxide reductase, partial [Pseudomonadota bacterium]